MIGAAQFRVQQAESTLVSQPAYLGIVRQSERSRAPESLRACKACKVQRSRAAREAQAPDTSPRPLGDTLSRREKMDRKTKERKKKCKLIYSDPKQTGCLEKGDWGSELQGILGPLGVRLAARQMQGGLCRVHPGAHPYAHACVSRRACARMRTCMRTRDDVIA